MATHVAFLRGINVGGHTVTNDRLAAVVADLGFTSVTTHQASGNVLFATGDPDADEQELEDALADGLASALGWPVPTFVRTADHVGAIAAAEPFPDAAEGGKTHVGFLRDALDADTRTAVEGFALATDRVAFDGRELYWHAGTGRMMDSGIGDPALARLLGDTWTLRTHATVQRIARKCG